MSDQPNAWLRLRRQWDRWAVYFPVAVMLILALLSYWLAHNSASIQNTESVAAPRHVPDYFMQNFSVRLFDAQGQLKSEMQGEQGRHYPDTDTIEIDRVQIRTFGHDGRVTLAHAHRGLSNADGSEVQLFGEAVIVRESSTEPTKKKTPRVELRSDFLDLFTDTETIRTNLPMTLQRGSGDVFTADAMDYDNLNQVIRLKGKVRGLIQPRQKDKVNNLNN